MGAATVDLGQCLNDLQKGSVWDEPKSFRVAVS